MSARAIAPFVRDKAVDPAVIVVDETGKFVIPILSGHLGGANVLASRIADEIGAEAVITTATDRNNVFSVDDWARAQRMRVENVPLIKKISACILSGGTIRNPDGSGRREGHPELCLQGLRRADGDRASGQPALHRL